MIVGEQSVGVSGTSLYSGDFAADLRAMIGALSKLPFDSERIVEIACSAEQNVALNVQEEDHSTFWLVVADQMSKRGMFSKRAFDHAIQIIDSEQDLKMLKRLGMADKDLTNRKNVLLVLRQQLISSQQEKPSLLRTVRKEPQPFLMTSGEVFVYPTCRGVCINSYCSSKEYMPDWTQDSWGVAIIVDYGRAFDFLAWYRPITTSIVYSDQPVMEQILIAQDLCLRSPGTCSKTHFKRIGMKKIGTLSIDFCRLKQLFPSLQTGDYQAIHDISIANELSIPVAGGKFYASNFRLQNRISSIAEILASA